jgi:cyclopropane-fatty-acyl-phospholipid synthase
MPSHTLLKSFQQHLVLEASWIVNGRHYGRTSNAWLKKMDDNTATIRPIFEKTYALPSRPPAPCSAPKINSSRSYGTASATMWIARWRGFYLACAELFDYNGGNEWFVSHYLFRKRC